MKDPKTCNTLQVCIATLSLVYSKIHLNYLHKNNDAGCGCGFIGKAPYKSRNNSLFL